MRISDWSSDVCSSDLGVAQVGTVVDVVLAAGRQDQLPGPGVGLFSGGRHPFGREAEIVDGVVGATGVVLDRAPGQPGRAGKAHGLGYAGRVVGEPDRKSTRLNSSH